MFVQKRCLFDTYVLQKKKLRREFRDSLTLWWVYWRMRLFYVSGERLLWVLTIARVQCCTCKYLQIYLCSIIAIRALVLYGEENLRFSPSRKILLYSLFLSDVSLENRPYRFFCVAAMIMMLIYASMCNIGLQSYLYRIDLKLIPRIYGRL